jgi:hypothetical protein
MLNKEPDYKTQASILMATMEKVDKNEKISIDEYETSHRLLDALSTIKPEKAAEIHKRITALEKAYLASKITTVPPMHTDQ